VRYIFLLAGLIAASRALETSLAMDEGNGLFLHAYHPKGTWLALGRSRNLHSFFADKLSYIGSWA